MVGMYKGYSDSFVVKNKCLSCGQVNDVATNILLEAEGPRDGAIFLCTGCGYIMRLRIEGDRQWFESLSAEEIRKHGRNNTKQWQVMMALQRKIRLEDIPTRRRRFLKG